MKSSMSLTAFLVLFLAIQVSGDLIDYACKRTPYYNLCVATLRSDPANSKAKIGPLALFATKKLEGVATSTYHQIMTLLEKETNPKLKQSLSICADGYNIVVKYDLPGLGGSNKFAIDTFKHITDTADKCGAGISGTPIASNNKLVHDLGDVAHYLWVQL